MNKSTLTRFIEKYHLGGNTSSVVLNSKDSSLSTRFVSRDKSLLGEVILDNWNFEDVDMGVYDTDQFLRLLSVLSDDIQLRLNVIDNKAVSLMLSDNKASVNFMLSDLSVINKPPEMKRVPDFEVKIKVDTDFIKKFVVGKTALQDTDTFTVLTDDDVKVVIGYSNINTNRVTLPVETESHEDIDNVSFNAELFKNVLIANKECETATLEISSEGLARINFKVDNYNATYYLVAVADVD
jgi:ribosome maturation factor RimP